MLPKIGFSLQKEYALPMEEFLALLKDAGFSAVSPVWSPELDLAAMDARVRALGMTIQSLHAPHKYMPSLWQSETPQSREILEAIFQSIDACAQYRIPILVLHCWQGFDYQFSEDDLYFRHFDRIIDHASAKGIRVALENLEGEEYLNALMARYQQNETVGYCWDSGHDHCYPHRQDFLEAFGDRLIMTHFNDNLGLRSPDGIPSGKDDLHFLPYDGNIDWDTTMARLKKLPRQSILNFEIKLVSHSKDAADQPYVRMPLEAFVMEARARANKIAQAYAKLTGTD